MKIIIFEISIGFKSLLGETKNKVRKDSLQTCLEKKKTKKKHLKPLNIKKTL